MGNQLLKNNKPPKEEKDGVVLRNKHNKKNGDFKGHRNKHQSCPEFGGAIPYNETTYRVSSIHDVSREAEEEEDNLKVEIKIYRSYGDLDRYRQELVRDQSNPDIRVYKRSQSSITAMSSTASLPKDFGGRNLTKQQKKKLLNGELPGTSGDDAPQDDVTDEDIVDVGRVSNEQKLSPQHRSAPNISVRKQLSSAFRFPGTVEVKRKLKVFEDRFRKSFLYKFLLLDENKLLDILCLARDLENQAAEVSVRQFLLGRGLPEELPGDQFVLLIPVAIYRLLSQVRQDGVRDRTLWRSLARDILTALAEEASRELSRMYEYQIVMLQEDVSIQLLALHSVDCVLEYVTRKRAMLHRNSVLRGVVTARPRGSEGIVTKFSVIIADEERKWDLVDVLKKPAIRKDIYYKDSDGLALGMDSPFPWRFFASDSDCNPSLYGYRGQMLEWDFVNEVYRMYPEERLYDIEQSFSKTNFHMHFVPYKILVNAEIMREYLDHILSAELPNRPNVSLTDFYKHSVPYQGDNRQQQMVYRPLQPLGANYTWRGAVLENMDLNRLDFADHPGPCQSLHSSVLMGADCRDAVVSNTDIDGCDFSYAVVGGGLRLPPHRPSGSPVQFVLMDDRKKHQELIMDEEGNGKLPAQVVSTKLKAMSDISPEKDSISELDYNFNMATHPRATRDLHGEKRRLSSGGSGAGKHRKTKQRRVHSHSLASSHGTTASDAQSTPSHSLSDSSQSPSRSDVMTSSSDALERGEIAYADAPPSYMELKAKRVAAPVLMFPPPPDYSPDKHSAQMSSVSPTSSPSSADYTPSSHSHQMSIESQVEAIMTSPVTSKPPPRVKAPVVASSYKATPKAFKKPVRKRASLMSIEETPGAVLITKLFFDQSPLYGRDEETNDITEAIVMNTRLVTITGCPGLGKSAVAIAVSRRIHDTYDMLPVLVDLRGCLSSDQVRIKISQALGLRLRGRHFELIGSWLGSHNRKILLVLDNLDLPLSELDGFADLLPTLLATNKVFLLCTSRKFIFGGDYGVTDYKLGDIEEASCDLLRDMVPDLPDSCVQELVAVCGYVPATVSLVGSALKHPDVSAQQLYQSLVMLPHQQQLKNPIIQHEQLASLCAEDDEPLTERMVAVVWTVVQHMPVEVRQLLSCLSSFHVPFDRTAAKAVLTNKSLESRLPDLPYTACTCYGGLLDKDPTGDLLVVPQLVKAVIQAQHHPNSITSGSGSKDNPPNSEFKYYTYYIHKITSLCQRYHSRDYARALTETWRDYGNILDALKRAMYDSRELYESCSRLATPDMCIFLYEALEESDYLDLYQCLLDVTKQWLDGDVDRCVLCCIAYFHLRGENFTEASALVNEAMELFPKPSPTTGPTTGEEVFAIMLGLYRGVLDWRADCDDDDEEGKQAKEDGIEKARRALEALKQSVGLQHALTIYAYETYSIMEKERGNYQKSRHFYNVLDLVGETVLGGHPALLEGYDARRAIWERQGLFCRANDVAKRASEVAYAHHGEHPLTAELHMKWVDCLLKVGEVPEASHAADVALGIRQRLYGDHIETVLAHKMVAYLNLRCGLYDDAINQGQTALAMSRRLRVHTAYLTDIETILTQAQRRKEAAALEADMDVFRGRSGGGSTPSQVQRHQVQVHHKTLPVHIPGSSRPQKPSRSTSASVPGACRREATATVPLHRHVRASLSTAV